MLGAGAQQLRLSATAVDADVGDSLRATGPVGKSQPLYDKCVFSSQHNICVLCENSYAQLEKP